MQIFDQYGRLINEKNGYFLNTMFDANRSEPTESK